MTSITRARQSTVRLIYLFAVAGVIALAAGSTRAQVRWVQYNENAGIPSHAVKGGSEDGIPLYVCTAKFQDTWQPGKVVEGKCNISYAGKEIVMERYFVLIGDGFWDKRGTANAFRVSGEGGQGLYLCRAHYQGHGLHTGKVVEGRCDFGYGGRQLASDDFDYFYPRTNQSVSTGTATNAQGRINLDQDWKSTLLDQGECVETAQRALRDSGFTNINVVHQRSVFARHGDYQASIRCVPEKKMVFFVVAGFNASETSRLGGLLKGNF